MNGRRFSVFSALAMALAVAIGGFHLLSGPWRDLESFLVMGLLAPLGDRAGTMPGHIFQLLPPDQEAFRAQLTPYCSSLISALALVVIAMFVLHGPLWPRVWAATVAVALVLLCNVLRIVGSLWMGYDYGGGALVLFHDWIGTFFALVYTMTGFFLMLYFLLPSATAEIPRAARVSDVL